MLAIDWLHQTLDVNHETRFGGQDLWRVNGGDFEPLIDAGVLVATRPATTLPAHCDCCVTHEVTRVEEPGGVRFYAVCPMDGMDPVEPSELQQWKVDGVGIAKVLASAMQNGQAAETLLPGKAWRIGEIMVDGEPFSVVFATRRGALQLAERRDATRMVVVGHRLPADGFAGTLPLGAAFDFSSDSVTPRPHRLRQTIPLSSVGVGNAFYRKGQMWVVRFGGDEVYLENNVGPLYIARLLATPHRAVPAVTLLASRIGIDERKLTGSSGELADEQSVAECRDRYRELMREIDEAKTNNDLGRLEGLQVEENKLTAHFASVLGKGGKPRDASEAIKISKSVSIAIRRTMDVLADELKPLSDHLEASITRGLTPIYEPETDVGWLT